jgi:hypothetical protein
MPDQRRSNFNAPKQITKNLNTKFNTKLDQRLWSFNAKLQHTRAKNLETQHKASTHQSKELGTSTQSFNSLD